MTHVSDPLHQWLIQELIIGVRDIAFEVGICALSYDPGAQLTLISRAGESHFK
jgi:hypothetical protein